MITLILLLALQGRATLVVVAPALPGVSIETAEAQRLSLNGGNRIDGKVVDDLKQPVRVTVRLKDDTTGNVVQTVDSFSNGTFHFDNVLLGFYYISVTDARYLIKDVHLDLREPENFGQTVLIPVVRNGAPAAAAGSANAEAYLGELNDLNMAELAKTTPPAAFEEFRKAVDLAKLGPKRNDILVAANGGSPDDTAEMHFKKAVALAPDFYEGHFQLGLEEIRQSHIGDAVSTLEQTVSMNATDPRPLRVLGELYLQQKQFQKAADVLVKVGTLGSLNADDRYHLGVAFEGLDNAAAAQQQFSTAISLAPGKNPQAYLHLHNMDIKLNQLPQGIAVLEDFIHLFPNDPNHKMAEDRVKKLRDALKKQP